MHVQRPRGTSDILPGSVERWQELERVAREVFARYGYREIRTPVFEHTEVFERGVGETTDIVQKEMYTFTDRAGRSVTLRPEGTAGVIRAFVENKLYGQTGVAKLYYIGPMFRYEKPQKGRERQFHQYGCEVLGSDGPAIDAEVIALNVDTLTNFGLRGLVVELNSVGCPDCRPRHRERMLEALRPYAAELCDDCRSRLEKNPLRIFDCKRGCPAVLERAGAPTVLKSLCEACETHLSGVRAHLDALGVPYVINERLVRGLDYYTRTAWEVTSAGFGTVGGGGRYNRLVAELGGPDVPGIGFAVGMERAILLRQEQAGQDGAADRQAGLDVFVAVADSSAELPAARLLQALRQVGLVADRDYQGRGLKAQFKLADRMRARYAAVLGESEVTRGVVTVKDLTTGAQTELPVDRAAAELARVAGQSSGERKEQA